MTIDQYFGGYNICGCDLLDPSITRKLKLQATPHTKARCKPCCCDRWSAREKDQYLTSNSLDLINL